MEDKYRISLIHDDIYEVIGGDKQVFKGSLQKCVRFVSVPEQGTVQELIEELFTLWEFLATSGEIHIGPNFNEQYKRLKDRVYNENTF